MLIESCPEKWLAQRQNLQHGQQIVLRTLHPFNCLASFNLCQFFDFFAMKKIIISWDQGAAAEKTQWKIIFSSFLLWDDTKQKYPGFSETVCTQVISDLISGQAHILMSDRTTHELSLLPIQPGSAAGQVCDQWVEQGSGHNTNTGWALSSLLRKMLSYFWCYLSTERPV